MLGFNLSTYFWRSYPKSLWPLAPAYRFGHNAGVASLAWISDGQLLAVGTHHRSLQLYDLRVSGTNSPPISVYAHSSDSVSGIEPDPHRSHVFCTYSKGEGEPVKLWDARRMDASLSEIKITGLSPNLSPSNILFSGTKEDHTGGSSGSVAVAVSAVVWSDAFPGTLSVAVGDTVRSYNTIGTSSSRGSRPVLTRIRRCPAMMQCVAFQPMGAKHESIEVTTKGESNKKGSEIGDIALELYPHRMLVVENDGNVRDLAKFQIAPLALSRRDGRISYSLGRAIWMGSTTHGEPGNTVPQEKDDIYLILLI